MNTDDVVVLTYTVVDLKDSRVVSKNNTRHFYNEREYIEWFLETQKIYNLTNWCILVTKLFRIGDIK